MNVIEQRLETAIASGNELKRDIGLGKEWYAVWAGHDNGIILEFLYQKAKSAHPVIAKGVSIVGTFQELFSICKGIFRHDANTQTYYIHKRRFKRHLKKALCRSRCIQ